MSTSLPAAFISIMCTYVINPLGANPQLRRPCMARCAWGRRGGRWPWSLPRTRSRTRSCRAGARGSEGRGSSHLSFTPGSLSWASPKSATSAASQRLHGGRAGDPPAPGTPRPGQPSPSLSRHSARGVGRKRNCRLGRGTRPGTSFSL